MKNRKMLGNLLLTLTALIWGTAFVAQRVGMDSIEPMTFTAARSVLAAAGLSVVSLLMRGRGAGTGANRRDTVLGGVCCGLFLAAASIFQQMGLVTTSAGKAGFITAMYMLLVPVISFVFFRRKVGWIVWLAVGIGVAGMYLLCVTEDFSLTRGDALVCVCAFLFSGHILCCDHFARRGDPVRISAIQFATVAVIAGAGALVVETPDWDKIASAAVPVLYCGIMSSGVAYTLQIVAQKYTDPTVASLLMSLESVFAALAGAVLLGERMSARELVGCVVMFAAIVLVQLPAPRAKRER